ncbi:hypothetical protein GOODEAATRI_010826, partial [Goodea atripinnis]
LIRYLVSGYVNGKVLDTLSEHANALASSAVASLEDEADQLSHFPFLSSLNDPVFTGIQRRITVTLIHEKGSELHWKDVRELVVGRIRNKAEVDDSAADAVLSLNIISAKNIKSSHNTNRTFYRFEAVWDSSLHNSLLLNRVTPYGEKIYMTLSAYLEVCSSALLHGVLPASGCQLTPTVSSLFSWTTASSPPSSLKTSAWCSTPGTLRSPLPVLSGTSLEVGTPKLLTGMQRRRRKVLDTSVAYVRGEENLAGWRPRGDSLILEHQWELEKLEQLHEVEKTRHLLLLREKLGEAPAVGTTTTTKSLSESLSPSMSSGTLSTSTSISSQISTATCESAITPSESSGYDSADIESLVDREKELASKNNSRASSPSCSDYENFPMVPTLEMSYLARAGKNEFLNLVPDIEEMRPGFVIRRCFMEPRSNTWVKHFVVIRRPYVFIYNSDKDPVERGVLNLSTAQVEYSEDQQAMLKERQMLRPAKVVAKHIALGLLTVSKVHDFLQNEAKGSKVIGAESLEDMVSKLKKPRRIILLVKAGQAVDDFIDKLVPLLEAGDIIIDGGNSEYRDTTVGDEGAGHFVKMVHNGIEYGDMQLICEAYHLMKDVLGMDHDEMAQVGWYYCLLMEQHKVMHGCQLKGKGCMENLCGVQESGSMSQFCPTRN